MMADQLASFVCDNSMLFAEVSAHFPTRNATRTISTPRGTNASSVGAEATAKAAKSPVQTPTTPVRGDFSAPLWNAPSYL